MTLDTLKVISYSRYLQAQAQVKAACTLCPETRLFLHVSPSYQTRQLRSFALLQALKRELGDNAYILKEV
jgi:hypothetical protein